MQRFAFALLPLLLLMIAAELSCSSDNGNSTPDAATPDVLPPAKPLTFDGLVEACVRVSACDVARRTRLAECIDNYFNREVVYGWRGLYDRAYSCANEAGSDCKLIRECFGFPGKPKVCDQDTYKPHCDGNIAVTCDKNHRLGRESWELQLDCTKGELKCALMTTGVNQITAACGGGPCDQMKDKPKCQESKKLTCRGSGWEINDCPEQHLQCRDPAVELCEGNGRSCPVGNPVCKGNILTSCVQGYLSEVDCAKLPGRKICDQVLRKCVGSGTECKTADFLDLCEGDTLVSCVDGYKRRFACKEMGFLGCAPLQPYGAYCRGGEVYE